MCAVLFVQTLTNAARLMSAIISPTALVPEAKRQDLQALWCRCEFCLKDLCRMKIEIMSEGVKTKLHNLEGPSNLKRRFMCQKKSVLVSF